MPSDAILQRLMALHPKVIDLSLDRMMDILDKLGNPHLSVPPVIHVAGTNGKGSLLAYLRAILEAAGYSVHVYTSPHLVRFNERIVLNGEVISDPELIDLFAFCEERNGGTPITYFEITTAAAFKAFADNPADVLLLETGLGGRLDATNVIPKPALTAITPVSKDHEQFLGSDVTGIALEKAGIMKPGVPVVLGPQQDAVMKTLIERAGVVGAPVHAHERDWDFTPGTGASDEWAYSGLKALEGLPPPSLFGTHQFANAATAIACAEKLDGFTLSRKAIEAGIQSTVWPARMQRLTKGPLIRQLPPEVEVWLDGGHNEAAGRQIAESFRALNKDDDKPTYLVCGMMNTKDQISFLRHLQPLVSRAFAMSIPGEEATTTAEELAQIGRNAGLDIGEAASLPEAVDSLFPFMARQPCRLLIAGSLYLAGTILRENG
nr:bifunctional folylpolyglutamate synthase/dihydrofolate synthase [Sneathiella chinensis]